MIIYHFSFADELKISIRFPHDHCWTLEFGGVGNLFAIISRRFPFILHKKVLLCASTPPNRKPFEGQKNSHFLVTKYLIQKENP